MSEITRLLSVLNQDDPAVDDLLPLVYNELRKLAAARLAHERPGQTLQATALVHEAYLRLVGGGGDREKGEEYAWRSDPRAWLFREIQRPLSAEATPMS